MHQVTIPEETEISNRQWQQAWNLKEILIRNFVAGFILAGILLIPLVKIIGQYSIVVCVLLPVLGIGLGIISWRRSCSAVNNVYQDILDGITDWDVQSNEEVQALTSEVNGSGTQYFLEPAQRYSLTYVEVADDYTLMEEITIDFASLEHTSKSERIPSEHILSQSFDAGVFEIRSSRGVWEFENLEER